MKLFKSKKKVPGFAILKLDRDFAVMLTSEYEIHFKLLCLNLLNIREAIDCSHIGDSKYETIEDLPVEVIEELPFDIPVYSGFSTRKEIMDYYLPKSTYRKCEEFLFPFEAKIESISIKSNLGVVCISPNDPIFNRLLAPVLKLKQAYQDGATSQNKVLVSNFIDAALRDTIKFLNSSTTLNKFQINVVVGRILVHFNLFKGKHLLREEDFDKNTMIPQDYKHYLNDIVKSRMKKIFKDLK